MNKIYLIIILGLLATAKTFAQNSQALQIVPLDNKAHYGYIITTRMDTIPGKITIIDLYDSEEGIFFQSLSGKGSRQTVETINGFGQNREISLTDSSGNVQKKIVTVRYESFPINQKNDKVFMQTFSAGKIRFYLAAKAFAGAGSSKGIKYWVRKNDEFPTLISEENDYRILAQIFANCSQVLELFKLNPEMQRASNIPNLVEVYNKSCK